MKTLLILLTTLMLGSMARARIGETLEQCKARYGSPVDANATKMTATFVKAGLKIVCTYRPDGVCWRICYEVADLQSKEGTGRLGTDEVKELLKLNGSDWQDGNESAGYSYFHTPQSVMMATMHYKGAAGTPTYDNSPGHLKIWVSKDADEERARNEQAKNTSAADKLKGL